MNRVAKFVCSLAGLTSIVAPLLAVLLYPKAKWLFALVLIGVAVLILNVWFAKDPTPQALADEIERLLTGHYGGWDVDTFEHRNIRDPQLRDFWHRTMKIGGLPEEWVRLNEEQKGQVRDIINQLRSEQANLQEGEELKVRVEDGHIWLQPLSQAPSLEAMVERITPENRHGAQDWGKPVGQEGW